MREEDEGMSFPWPTVKPLEEPWPRVETQERAPEKCINKEITDFP